MPTYSKQLVEKISRQIEKFKVKYGYENYVEAILAFMEETQNNEEYDFLHEKTIKDFIDDSLKEKLLIDASDLNMITDEAAMKSNNLLF